MEWRYRGFGGELFKLVELTSLPIDKSHRTYLDKFLNRGGPATDEEWVPGEEAIRGLESSKVLSVSLRF